MWPSQSPSGIAIAQAIAIAASESLRCSQISSHMFARPPTCAPPAGDVRSLKMKSIASPNSPRKAKLVVIAPPPPASTE